MVVVTTWALWYVGIVVPDGDDAFTVTRVLAHHLPCLVSASRCAAVAR